MFFKDPRLKDLGSFFCLIVKMRTVNFEDLIGKVFIEVKETSSDITFIVSEDEKYIMYHDQDCCESVVIDDIAGDLKDLIGSPIVLASEDTNRTDLRDPASTYIPDSFTWTFYNIATIKGHVTIRWYGESNGYYSESVYIKKV